MDLRDAYPIPVCQGILIEALWSHLHLAARLLHHAIIDHIKLIVEEDFTVYLSDDVVFHEH